MALKKQIVIKFNSIYCLFAPKITGKKVYSAGQWTGASVSSLFASKPPPEPVAQEIAASQPQVSSDNEILHMFFY